MVDTLLHAELLAACSSLGYSDGIKYYREAHCLETTKDLVRYLRKDDESHEIRRALGETRVVQTDLIPMIRDHSEDAELFDVIIRLLVNLTNPVILLFREELPEEKVTRQQYLHLLSQQQAYKEAFVEEKVWSVLVGKLGELLQLDWENRQEDDRLIIERILILVRNILFVPASPEEEKRTEDDASIHDQVLWALHLAGFEDLLLYIASSENEQDLCMHALEIISYMLREQDPAQLAKAGLQRSQTEKEKDEKELQEIRRREALKKQQQRSKYYGARHSRFGGTYYVQNMKSISDRDLISHRPLADVKSINFDFAKRPKKTARNRADMVHNTSTRRSTLAIRLFLQEFCIELLNGAYNSIMYVVKDNLNRAKSQEHDDTYYMWAIKFFMEFNRHHEFKVELVSETLNIQMFHYLQTHLENYYGMMTTDKKKIPFWSRRMHKALRAYQEILMTLAYMDKSTEDLKEAARVLKSKLFYVVEYREMILVLLQNYDRRKMSIVYLKDLVETAHTFIKLLEKFCGKTKHIIVQRKHRTNQKRKKPKAVSTQLTEDQLQVMWDEMSAELSSVVQGEAGDLPEMIPFDAASEDPDETQKENAMRRINALLRRKEMPEAVSLLRAAREVWPEGIFGEQTISPSDEFLSLREIFMAELNPVEPPQEEEEEDEDDEEDEEEEAEMEVREEDFDFQSFIRRFAHTKVMQAYAQLFQQYAKNNANTNHCILRMFHRIAWDCKLPAMFFQASLFCVFREAMHDDRRNTDESVKEIVKFGKFIVREFFKTYETNNKVFAELFFWKDNKEAVEIMCGYEFSASGREAAKRSWTEEEEDELRRLYQEFENAPMETLASKDCVELILDNLINQKRTRRGVIKKLKDLGLITQARDVKSRKSVNVRAPKMWTEEEEGELKMLFEENKDAMDIVGRILDHMVMRRPKPRVIEKILELGLVSDRKELRKKRVKKPKVKKPKKRDTSDLGERFEVPDDDDDEVTDGSESEMSNGEATEPSDDDDEEAPLRKPSQKQASHKPSQKQVSYVAPVVTPGLIAQALKTVVEANMQTPLEWLIGVLQDVADDREEDGDFEPIPILALTEACTDAMEDGKFQELVKLLGLQPPLNHQEMFWRVPSRLSVDALRKRVHYLKQGLSGTPIDVPSIEEPLDPPVVEEIAGPSKAKKKGPRISKKDSKKDKKSGSTDSKPKVRRQRKKKKALPSEENSDAENIDPENKENHQSGPSLPIHVDDSVPLLPVHVDDSVPLLPVRGIEEDSSDDDIPLSRQVPASSQVKKRLGSDSESDSKLSAPTLKSAKKKRRFVVDDDSDDEAPLVASQDLNLHMDTEVIDTNTQGILRLGSDDDDDSNDVPLSIPRQRAKAVIESDDE
ncbi:protein timeless homolog [Palaemon carinicauda]|uniref:protein timeless homolog n=1 Tax=Palaemon carinicauda TaxID=392227 RepID=UPI0035B572B5